MVKLSEDTIIASEKLTDYLLTYKKRNDKSQWLAKAGYNIDNWTVLKQDLERQILPMDAKRIEVNAFGQVFEIKGDLIGPNCLPLSVSTIWLKETISGVTKFITMYPNKKEQ